MADVTAAAKVLLEVCGECRKDEKILIITEPSSVGIALPFFEAAKDYPNRNLLMIEETGLHGANPSPRRAAEALSSPPA